MAERARIAVAGVVQGVGFRPFVHALATDLGVRGFITNTADGVLIEAEGDRLAEFLARLRTDAPPLARVTGLSVEDLPFHGHPDFSIRKSVDSPCSFTLVSPDVSLCADCRRELVDPADRRYRYPFINCTNCGPRYSITRSVPYDRPNTTMAAFTMCPDCSREYHDPLDRRFHAQPNACPECGPNIEFRMRSAERGVKGMTALEQCVDMLKNGGIVAIKGLGGFHIACDAANRETVSTLRQRKRKSNKPFAVMAPDIPSIRSFCEVSDGEKELLLSLQRPIVLLRKSRQPLHALSDAVSPGNRYIGCMLPYTPLQELLFQREGASFRALVMTSGNLSEEPIVRDNDEAIEKLSGLAEAFLLHDRDIFMRVDDSVVRSAECGVRSDERKTGNAYKSEVRNPKSAIMFIRRSRGYAPDPVALHQDGPEVLGCGADLKNTFTLTKGTWAIPSQHIGDMENYETLRFYEECLANLKQVYRAEPVAIVHDLHPGYLSTRWAMEQLRSAECGVRNDVQIFGIQHHYAHIGSVMAEHGLTGPVIGVAFDGTGYGTDGKLWGGEFLIAAIDGFERVGQFKDVPLPGGEAAIREPWRTAVSYCREASGERAFGVLERLGFVERHGSAEVRQVLQVAGSEELSPRSSGAGRLFDAVSALMGLCSRNTFEGEAAMALESCVVDGVQDEYPVELREKDGYTVVDFAPLVDAVANDVIAQLDPGMIATRFHNTVASSILNVVRRIREQRGIALVALSGGTFQNRYLLERTLGLLGKEGIQVFINREVPPNDACISLGQAYLIRERLKTDGARNAERLA